MSIIDKYLKGEVEGGKIELADVLKPEMAKEFRHKPDTVRLETCNHCNAQCLFCGYPNMKRTKGYMDTKLFKKIIDECKEIRPKLIKPFGHGELFMDPKWKQRLQYIDDKLDSLIHIETNALLLDEDASKFLLGLDHLGTVALHISGGTSGQTQKLMGIDGSKIENNAKQFFNMVADRKRPVNAFVVMPASPTFVTVYDGQIFRRNWGPLSHTNMCFNYAGHNGIKRGVLHDQEACQGLNEINILWDGRVSLCWFDMECEEPLGNVSTDSIIDVWNSERATALRTLHKTKMRADIPICNRCDFC
jgi:radical SAM protein with 4Fe4S-binding SPASM domain